MIELIIQTAGSNSIPDSVLVVGKTIGVLVRCEDCKHYIVEGITTQYGWCHEYKHSVNEDDYCSYGERKEK